MAGELKLTYVKNRPDITFDVTTPAGVSRITDVAGVNTPAGSAYYIGDYAAINPGDIVAAYDNGLFLGGEIYEPQAALVTTIADPDPAGGSTTDAIFDLVKGSSDDDEYSNMVVTIQDVSGGIKASRRIIDYDGANKRVTLDFPAEFPLAVGDTVTIWANAYENEAGSSPATIAAAVWDALKSAHKDSGSMGLLQGIQHF